MGPADTGVQLAARPDAASAADKENKPPAVSYDPGSKGGLVGHRVRKNFGSRIFWGTVVGWYTVSGIEFLKVSFDDGDVDVFAAEEIVEDVQQAKKYSGEDKQRPSGALGDSSGATDGSDSSPLSAYQSESRRFNLKRRREEQVGADGVIRVRLWGKRLHATIYTDDKRETTLREFISTNEGEMGELEASGLVRVGDRITAVNATSTLGMASWQVSDLIRLTERPIWLTFERGAKKARSSDSSGQDKNSGTNSNAPVNQQAQSSVAPPPPPGASVQGSAPQHDQVNTQRVLAQAPASSTQTALQQQQPPNHVQPGTDSLSSILQIPPQSGAWGNRQRNHQSAADSAPLTQRAVPTQEPLANGSANHTELNGGVPPYQYQQQASIAINRNPVVGPQPVGEVVQHGRNPPNALPTLNRDAAGHVNHDIPSHPANVLSVSSAIDHKKQQIREALYRRAQNQQRMEDQLKRMGPNLPTSGLPVPAHHQSQPALHPGDHAIPNQVSTVTPDGRVSLMRQPAVSSFQPPVQQQVFVRASVPPQIMNMVSMPAPQPVYAPPTSYTMAPRMPNPQAPVWTPVSGSIPISESSLTHQRTAPVSQPPPVMTTVGYGAPASVQTALSQRMRFEVVEERTHVGHGSVSQPSSVGQVSAGVHPDHSAVTSYWRAETPEANEPESADNDEIDLDADVAAIAAMGDPDTAAQSTETDKATTTATSSFLSPSEVVASAASDSNPSIANDGYILVEISRRRLYVTLGQLGSRVAVTAFVRNESGGCGELEECGRVFVGDVVVAINGVRLSLSASPNEVARLIATIPRPMTLSFERASWDVLEGKN